MSKLPRICEEYKQFKSIIIFGASTLGAVAFTALKENVKIIAFSDNDVKKHGNEFCGVKIIPPAGIPALINQSEKSAVLIASMYFGSISFQLSEMGVKDFFIFLSMQGGTSEIANDYTIRIPLNISEYENICISAERRRTFLSDFSKYLESDERTVTASMSTSTINYSEDKSKNILFIAYSFPPMGGSGVQRSSKFVKYLKKLGYNPIVLAAGHTDFLSFTPTDETLLMDIPPDMTIIRIDDPYHWDDNMTEGEIRNAVRIIDGIANDTALITGFLNDMSRYNHVNHRLGRFFTPWAGNVLIEANRLIDFDKIGAVYTSSDPYFDHYIGFYIKRKYNIPWITDFRDEWTNNPLDSFENITEIEKQLERRITDESDALVVISEPISVNFCKICNIPKEKTYIITNGYDEGDFIIAESERAAHSSDSKVLIKYSGSVYIDYDPIPEFIMAVNELIEDGDVDKSRLDIRFNGVGGSRKEEFIKRFDTHGIIKISPYLRHIENIKNMQRADIILLFRCNKIECPGKIFEYMRMGVPVLAVAPSNGVIDKLLTETRTGVCVDPKDKDGIKRAFMNMYNTHLNGTLKINPNYEEVEKYSRENLTKKLIKIIEKIEENM